MKRLMIISLAIILAIMLIGPVSLLSAAGSGVKGEIIVEPEGTASVFSGHIQLLSDDTVTGQWQWIAFNFCGNPVKFSSNQFTNLSFPNEKTATFNGLFTSNDMLLFTGQQPVTCELHFVIAPIGTEANPGGLPVGLPPGITLPPGLGAGSSILLVYCSGGQFITSQQGNYQVNVY